MECMSRIAVGSIGHEKRYCRAVLFHLFIRIGFVYDCTVWTYVLQRMFKETEYDLFYLPWSDTGTCEVVFCIIDYSTLAYGSILTWKSFGRNATFRNASRCSSFSSVTSHTR